MASCRKTVADAAEKATRKLAASAPFALRMIRRVLFGMRRHEEKEALALAELLAYVDSRRRGAYQKAIAEVDDVFGRRDELTSENTEEARTIALAAIESGREAAVADMTAMGLSAARTATLIAILGTLAETANVAASTAIDDVGNRAAKRVLNKCGDQIIALSDAIQNGLGELRDAIERETKRLDIWPKS